MSTGSVNINRTVWILAMVSLFADFASEMLYPIVPVYLKEIGFSIALIGVLEGIAEFVVGLTKGYFGNLSDQRGRRLPFVRMGYALSAISKPLMAFFIYPVWIFFARTIDRLGKGMRSAARDAILAGESTPHTRARVFGFHRGWDTVGAILGPSAALAFLHFYPGAYRPLFFWAFIPGVISVALLFMLHEKKIIKHEKEKTLHPKKAIPFFSFFSFWREGSQQYRRLVIGLLLFALANSSDAFLLLQAKAITGSDTITISAYIFYNIIYAAAAFPMGMLADRWGLKKTILGGMTLFVVVYSGFAYMSWNGEKSDYVMLIFILFLLYGLYAAATEGISKALISNLVDRNKTATALGLYGSLQSICTLLSSSMAGFIWMLRGASFTFLAAAILAISSIIWLLLVPVRNESSSHDS
ncbi:MFS transporter [Flavihumibacter sp. ZG627]|uniref:MFS transporter n=1 Tax=Flavihumibacter sp. ZG627 TaxID=1463156 RepID=UPI00057CD65C|nr:MFS transporter [Flavihumibacter sp. ZG627]KIC92380.1 ABC transporter permease [Flavihumibacter sp. ZG627]